MYKATIKTSDEETKTYIGCTNNTFKERFYGHSADLRDPEKRNNTKLANYVWEKKDKGEQITDIKWEIVKKCQEYVGGSAKCDVCVTEKLYIMKEKSNSLNKRSELNNKCMHMRSWLLDKVKAVKDG